VGVVVEWLLVLVEIGWNGWFLRRSQERLMLLLRYLWRWQSLRRLVELLVGQNALLLSELVALLVLLVVDWDRERLLRTQILLQLRLLVVVSWAVWMERLDWVLAWEAQLMGQMALVLWSNEVVVGVEVSVRSLEGWRLSKLLRWLVEVYWRAVDDASLALRSGLGSFFFDWACWSNSALGKLNDRSYGTFDFNFIVDLVVGLAMVIVGRAKSDVNAAVTFVLLGIWPNDGTEGCWLVRDLRDWRHDDGMLFFLLIFLVMSDW
jgi:hypothetical protein